MIEVSPTIARNESSEDVPSTVNVATWLATVLGRWSRMQLYHNAEGGSPTSRESNQRSQYRSILIRRYTEEVVLELTVGKPCRLPLLLSDTRRRDDSSSCSVTRISCRSCFFVNMSRPRMWLNESNTPNNQYGHNDRGENENEESMFVSERSVLIRERPDIQ